MSPSLNVQRLKLSSAAALPSFVDCLLSFGCIFHMFLDENQIIDPNFPYPYAFHFFQELEDTHIYMSHSGGWAW